MKKFITLIALTVGSLAIANPVKLSNISINETIKNTFGPNVNINYKKFDVDHSLDMKNKSGHINMKIYPELATVSPQFYNSIVKGKDTLDVENYKIITFKSSKVNFTEDYKISSISGTLTVKNKSIPVTFKANSFVCKGEVGERTCTVSYTAPLDRTKLNMNYGTSIGLSKQAPITLKLTSKE